MREAGMSERAPMSRDDEWRYAEKALTWHGWGSPVGLGLGLLCLGVTALLLRLALLGW